MTKEHCWYLYSANNSPGFSAYPTLDRGYNENDRVLFDAASVNEGSHYSTTDNQFVSVHRDYSNIFTKKILTKDLPKLAQNKYLFTAVEKLFIYLWQTC